MKSSLLFLALTFSISLHSFAETDTASGLDFRIENDGTATIIDNGDIQSNSDLVIPSNVVAANGQTYTVKKIGDRAFYNNSLTSVSIPNTVTEIGRQSFLQNPNLTSLLLGQNVQSIRHNAFENCGLTSLSLPNSLTRIFDQAFLNCQIATVSFNSTIQRMDQSAFAENNLQQLVLPESLATIGSGVFEENSLTYVKFLGDKNNFQSNMFYQNRGLNLIEVCLEKNFPHDTVFNNHRFSNTTPEANITVTSVKCAPNQAPIANAGPDQTIQDDSTPGESITLDASSSSDDKGINGYLWSGSDGSSYAGVSPTVNSPVGTTVYTLTVTDADGASDTDSVSVTVNAYSAPSSDSSSGAGSSSDTGSVSGAGSNSNSSTGTGSGSSSNSSSNTDDKKDTNPRIDQCEVPSLPQQSLPKIIRTDGGKSNSSISIGGSTDGGDSYSTSYTVDDEIVLTANIYPDEADVGKAGELYVVIRSKVSGLKIFSALNKDGNWELWNASLKTLPAARYIEKLQTMEEINFYCGYMAAGQRLVYVGYSLYTDGKPVITTSLSPFKITVSE